MFFCQRNFDLNIDRDECSLRNCFMLLNNLSGEPNNWKLSVEFCLNNGRKRMENWSFSKPECLPNTALIAARQGLDIYKNI
jgi:hypothetical protein